MIEVYADVMLQTHSLPMEYNGSIFWSPNCPVPLLPRYRKVPLGWIEDHSKAYSSLELTVVIAWSENKAPQNPGGLWWFMYVYVLWCSSSKWPFRGTCGRYASFLDTYRIVGYVSHYIQKNMSGLSLERPWLGVNPFKGVLSTL
jgi:hypothetical protein